MSLREEIEAQLAEAEQRNPLVLVAATFEEEGRVPTADEAVRGLLALCQELTAALLRVAEAVDDL